MSSATPKLIQRGDTGPELESTHDLSMQVDQVVLKTLSTGVLNAWYATALRGLVLKPLRDHFCHLMGGRVTFGSEGRQKLPALLPDAIYCQGCAKNAQCGYGRVFEPDLKVIAPGLIRQGAAQGLRGITFATPVLAHDQNDKPADDLAEVALSRVTVEAGTVLSVRILALGTESIQLLPLVSQTLHAFGRTSGLWGQPPVHFIVQPQSTRTESLTLSPSTLPIQFCSGIVPLVRIDLQTPLSLKRSCPGDHRTQLEKLGDEKRHFSNPNSAPPTFREIFSNSFRTIRRAINEFADPTFCDGLPLGEFINASEQVSLVEHNLRYFEQQRASRRHDEPHNQSGWLGSLTFRDVPLAYIPWLMWAGKLGIGDSRNCGAGLWHVVLG